MQPCMANFRGGSDFFFNLDLQTTLLKTREKQLQRDLEEIKETKSGLEEEVMKLKTQKSVDDVQMKELQDTLEAEQYFSVGLTIHDPRYRFVVIYWLKNFIFCLVITTCLIKILLQFISDVV